MARIYFQVTSHGSMNTHSRMVNSIDEMNEALSAMKSDPLIGGIDVEFCTKQVVYKPVEV